MFCEKCGSKLPENAKFCAGCGAKAELAQPIASQPQAQYTPPATTYQTSPVQAPQPQPQVHAYTPTPAYSPAQSQCEILSVKQYMVMLLLLCIPIVNFVLLLMWSFGSSAGPSKKNFARAMLFFTVIMVVLWFVVGGVFMGALSQLL